tara:strand:- start:169 stop:357 length:189 start_codon:yes stop_codon:yes gene_type:complete
MENNDKYKKIYEEIENKLKKIPLSIEERLCLRDILKDYKEQLRLNPDDKNLLCNIKKIQEYL